MNTNQYEAKAVIIDGATYHYNEANYYWDRWEFYKAIGTPFAQLATCAKADTDEKFGRIH
jgi:hypothetical protein